MLNYLGFLLVTTFSISSLAGGYCNSEVDSKIKDYVYKQVNREKASGTEISHVEMIKARGSVLKYFSGNDVIFWKVTTSDNDTWYVKLGAKEVACKDFKGDENIWVKSIDSEKKSAERAEKARIEYEALQKKIAAEEKANAASAARKATNGGAVVTPYGAKP